MPIPSPFGGGDATPMPGLIKSLNPSDWSNASAVASVMQKLQQGPTTAAGRYSNPTAEIGRLLDELQKQRDALSNISIQPTQSDLALQQQIQQATLQPALAQVSGGFGSRGLSGSSLEAVQRTIVASQAAQQSQQAIQNAQENAYQRAQLELGKNRQLYESLTGAITSTGKPGAPGTQLQQKRKGGGILGALGGVAGAVIGSAAGPVGTAIGSRIGSAIGGGVGGGYPAPLNSERA